MLRTPTNVQNIIQNYTKLVSIKFAGQTRVFAKKLSGGENILEEF
jgi:hypothetical protein